MQNSFMALTTALFSSCLLFLQVPRLQASFIEAEMQSETVQPEPAPAGQDAAKPTIVTVENNVAAEQEYAAGRTAMRRRDWKAAIQAFKRTVELNPDYRDARNRLAEARTILNNEEIEAVAARYYDEGVAAMNRNDTDGALDAFEKVSRINRRYRDLEELYARLEGKLPQPSVSAPPIAAATFSAAPKDSAEILVAKQAEPVAVKADSLIHPETAVAGSAKLDSLVEYALAAFERDDWKSAVIAFERIKFVQPNYHDLDDLAMMARTNLLRQAPNAASPARNDDRLISLLMIILAVITAIGWLGFGLLAVSPAGRARLYRWRGNDVAAALLYEQMIAQKPERVELYPLLAETYLRLKRQDTMALQIFQKVLELNLPTRYRAEFHALIAQQERHKDLELSTPRKPRKKKELATILERVNGAAGKWSNTNGRFVHEDPEPKANE